MEDSIFSLAGYQRSFLKRMAHHLKPVVMLGQAGLTPEIIKAVDQSLGSHELIKLKFQDFKSDRRVLSEEIARKTEMGKILGNGPQSVGKHFDHHRIPVVKGQSIAAYDPRGMQGLGVTYATSPMGADHTAGNMVGQYMGGQLDPLSAEGQVEASRSAQIAMAALDTVGLCILAGTVLGSKDGAEALVTLISAKTGVSPGKDTLPDIGKKVLKLEREFNSKAGFTSTDDRLPAFFRKEALPPHNKVFLVKDEDLDKVYEF